MNCGTACPSGVQSDLSVTSDGTAKLQYPVHSDVPFRWSDWSARVSRLNAPRQNGAKLVEPPPSLAGQMAAINRSHICGAQYDIQGRNLCQLATEARRQVLDEALQYSRSYRDVAVPSNPSATFLAGHQPEMFHPGVWFKNFELGRLAQQHNALAINLVIDSDATKSTALRLPGGSIEHPRAEVIPFDRAATEVPFEQRDILDPQLFSSFGDRVLQQLRPLVPDPIVAKYWPMVVARSHITRNLGMCLSQARHQLEAEWGLQTLEIPQSRVCDLPAVRWFIVHLLAHLPRLWSVYNSALAEYRRVHKVRSGAHPAPDLVSEDDWLEAPFWIWSADDPKRHRLFVRQRNDKLMLRNHAGHEATLSISPEGDATAAIEQLMELEERGIRIRSRALITTMTARLLLGDLFLHGIGGAKYDQVTDHLIAEFFGVEPPGYMVASGTLHLPLAHEIPHSEKLLRLKQQIRELEFHPERFLQQDSSASTPNAPEVSRWIEEKRRWIETQPLPQTARQRCRAIRGANESLQGAVASLRNQWTAAADELSGKLRSETILGSREYAFVLFPESILTKFFQ